jgi:hypothetical protein
MAALGLREQAREFHLAFERLERGLPIEVTSIEIVGGRCVRVLSGGENRDSLSPIECSGFSDRCVLLKVRTVILSLARSP